MYQIKTRVNSQTVNNDIECDSKDDLINFHNAVSTSEILEIKEYIYTSQDDSRLIDDTKSRYAGLLEILCQSDRITYSKGRTHERDVRFK